MSLSCRDKTFIILYPTFIRNTVFVTGLHQRTSWQLSEASLKELVIPTWFASITDLQITHAHVN